MLFVGVADNAGHALYSSNFFGRSLSITTGHHYAGARVVTVNPPDRLAGLGISGPSDGAGVDDHDVRGRTVSIFLQFRPQERLLERSPVRLTGPTTEVDDGKRRVTRDQ